MAYSFLEDNEATFFATTSDDCDTNFNNLFDLDSDYPSLDVSDISTSHDSSSSDINFFKNLEFENEFLGNSFFTTCADTPSDLLTTVLPTRISRQNLSSIIPLHNAPKTVRLVYRTRPESVAITGAQLIALENKDNSYASSSLTNLRSPPATPHHNRSQLSTPPRKQARRTYRTEKSSNRPTYKPMLMSSSPKAISSAKSKSRQQQVQIPSPQLMEWNERIHHFAVQAPQHGRTLPASPPSSSKIDQIELSQNTSQTMVLENQDDLFNPSSSTTTVSSTELTHPFLDGSSPSTIDSSPWNADAAAELFGLKQNPWDLPALDLGSASPNPATDNSEISGRTHEHLSNRIDNPFSTISNKGGLGISIGTTGLGTNPFNPILTSINPSSESRSHTHPESNSTKLPAMPFNSPASEFCSPALSSDLSFIKTNTAFTSSPPLHPSKPAHTTSKHRRTKSTPSIQCAARRTSSSKVRTPKTPKEKSPVVGGLGFVNYTPEDRTRILTGVAPSGSSKTKARREKEALERRRKLSEAAKRLVVEAGGDGDAVDRELSE